MPTRKCERCQLESPLIQQLVLVKPRCGLILHTRPPCTLSLRPDGFRARPGRPFQIGLYFTGIKVNTRALGGRFSTQSTLPRDISQAAGVRCG